MALTNLDYWRLADELSVINAAILITGNDPTEKTTPKDASGQPLLDSDGEMISYQRTDYVGLDAVLQALRGAILANRLRARIQHRVRRVEEHDIFPHDGISHVSHANQSYQPISYDFLMTKSEPDPSVDAKATSNFALDNLLPTDEFYVWKEPDWARTTVAVDDLKDWLNRRGMKSHFFFDDQERVLSDSFLNPSHDHFAPELALAVAVWRALETEQTFKRSPKTRILDWIKQNPEAWKGEEPVSEAAKDRIATLVNWKREGGAPISGG